MVTSHNKYLAELYGRLKTTGVRGFANVHFLLNVLEEASKNSTHQYRKKKEEEEEECLFYFNKQLNVDKVEKRFVEARLQLLRLCLPHGARSQYLGSVIILSCRCRESQLEKQNLLFCDGTLGWFKTG